MSTDIDAILTTLGRLNMPKSSFDHINFYVVPFEDEACGYNGPGWYFWDETQSNCYGPFSDVLVAHSAQQTYFQQLN